MVLKIIYPLFIKIIRKKMVGFRIKIKNKTVDASIKRGVLTIVLTNHRVNDKDNIVLEFSGFDVEKNEHITWVEESLNLGDNFNIEIKDIELNSSSLDIRSNDEIGSDENKLKTYKKLRKELKDKGLI